MAKGKFATVMLGILSASIETVGESNLVDVLDKLKEKDPEQYPNAIAAGRLFVKSIKPFVDASKNKVDDLFVSSFSDAIEASAQKNGIPPAE